jgi:hypothetical protein
MPQAAGLSGQAFVTRGSRGARRFALGQRVDLGSSHVLVVACIHFVIPLQIVAIQSEGDYVTLSLVRDEDDPAAQGKKYTTTWFDMLRVVNGKLVEHWDSATKGAAGPVAASATKR